MREFEGGALDSIGVLAEFRGSTPATISVRGSTPETLAKGRALWKPTAAYAKKSSGEIPNSFIVVLLLLL